MVSLGSQSAELAGWWANIVRPNSANLKNSMMRTHSPPRSSSWRASMVAMAIGVSFRCSDATAGASITSALLEFGVGRAFVSRRSSQSEADYG